MADRYWIVGHGMGYMGTSSENEVDICDYLGLPEDEVVEWQNDAVENQLTDMEFEAACKKISVWAKPKKPLDT